MTQQSDTQSIGDEAQIRKITDPIARAAATIAISEFASQHPDSEFASQHPELRQASVTTEIPAPLKWASVIIAGLFTAGTATLAFWLVSTVSLMQVTLARMDERLANQTVVQSEQLKDISGRVTALESYHRQGVVQ